MKTAFITGSNRGLGKGFVDHLTSEDYLVFAASREFTNQKREDNLHEVQLDVSDDKSIEEAFDYVSQNTDELNLLINNAGINKDSATENHKEFVCNLIDLKREYLLHMMNVNAISSLIILKKFLPLLIKTSSFVINISSDRASFHDEFTNTTGNYGYRASKIALNMYTFCSVQDLPGNVQTFAVHPGNMKTDMNPDGTDDPKMQAEKIISITNNWRPEFNGAFLRYDGTVYPL